MPVEPATPVAPPPAPSVDGLPLSGAELRAELRRLEALYPPPVLAEWVADYSWLAAATHAPWFEPYFGRCVAVLGERIVGVGDDEPALRLQVATGYHVHPERVVISVFGESP